MSQQEAPSFDEQVNNAIEVLIDEDADMIFAQSIGSSPQGGNNAVYSLGSKFTKVDGRDTLTQEQSAEFLDLALGLLSQHIVVTAHTLQMPPGQLCEIILESIGEIDATTEHMQNTQFPLVEEWETEDDQ